MTYISSHTNLIIIGPHILVVEHCTYDRHSKNHFLELRKNQNGSEKNSTSIFE